MQHDGDQDGGNVSIGEQDQLRDREMLRELQDEDGQQDDQLDPARHGKAPKAPPSAGASRPAGSGEEEWHPGEAEQPDRSTSEGLTGSGPAQPEP